MANKDYIFDLSIDNEDNRYQIDELLSYSQLRTLTLKNYCIYDKDIAVINQLIDLIEIDFVNCKFLNKLEEFKNANILKLSFFERDASDYHIFSKMNRLRFISIVDCDDVTLENISEIQNLTELKVLNSSFLTIKNLFQISNRILFDISGSQGFYQEELKLLSARFNIINQKVFVNVEGDNDVKVRNSKSIL